MFFRTKMYMLKSLPGVDLRINSAGYSVAHNLTRHRMGPMADYDLRFVWSGRARVHDGTCWYPAEPGTVMCLRPGLTYVTEFQKRYPLGHAHIHFDYLNRKGLPFQPREQRLPPHFRRIRDVGFTRELMCRIADLKRSRDPSNHAVALQYMKGLVLSLCVADPLLHRSAAEREHHDKLEEVIRWVREDVPRTFDLAGLAEAAGYDADYFTRVFKRLYGMSPKRFFIELRMERACSMLAETSMSVEEVAGALGYADVYFFSRQFKVELRLSPSRWRKQRA